MCVPSVQIYSELILLYEMDQSVGHYLFKYTNQNAVQLCLYLYTMAKNKFDMGLWEGVSIEP